MSRLDLEWVQAHLTGLRLRGPLVYHEVTASTNDDARAMAVAGAPEGTVVIAGEQSAGRGRRERAWFGDPHNSLLFSFILRPTLPAHEYPRLVNTIGVAVAEACSAEAGCAVGTKWPNDVIAEGRKVGGILLEASAPHYAIVGIGLNVLGDESQFPPELRDTAGALAACATRDLSREPLLAAVLNQIDLRYDDVLQGRWDDIVTTQRGLETTLGRTVTIQAGGTAISGSALDLSPSGGLILDTADGRRVIDTGEIL